MSPRRMARCRPAPPGWPRIPPQRRWKPLAARSRLAVQDFGAPPPAGSEAEDGTDLDGALDRALAHTENLKAALLLTDGDWNLGPSPLAAATKYSARDIPIYAIGIGSETPLPDLDSRSLGRARLRAARRPGHHSFSRAQPSPARGPHGSHSFRCPRRDGAQIGHHPRFRRSGGFAGLERLRGGRLRSLAQASGGTRGSHRG